MSTCNGTPGDTDLTALAGGVQTNDATVLSFDFVPTYNTISFQYVFASEEYNEFVDSMFNDVFAFYINGINVALIPGTNTIVSINNVNDCVNSAYFIDNVGSSQGGGCGLNVPSANLNASLNGLTTVLTVNASVNPGVNNHIKLAIADVEDCELDSNVFIQANSFASVLTNTPTGTPAFTLTPTPTPTMTDTPTFTPTPTNTPTITPTSSFTPTPTFTPTVTPTPTCEVLVWPDPYNPAHAVGGVFKVSCMPPGAIVSIYTLSGEYVNQAGESRGLVIWDGRNKYGSYVSAGIYYYVAQQGGRTLKTGKFLVTNGY